MSDSINLGSKADAAATASTDVASLIAVAKGILANTAGGGGGPTANVNVASVAGTTAASGAGASTAGSLRTITATDSPEVTALQIMDDWDETDRCKVNPIAGQAGISGGAGASSALTTRNIAATDSPDVIALQIIDDWDESDRAKVNLVVGQAGVAGGTGADAANVQRVSLATDIPLPAGTNAIGKLSANSGIDIGDVDVTSVIPGTGATNLGKAEDAVHTSGDVGVMSLAVANVAQATFSADGDYTPFATDLAGNHMIVGNIANDAVDSGNPVKMGGFAVVHGAQPTAVGTADRVNWLFARSGVPFVMGGHPNIVTIEAAYTAAQTDTAIVTATSSQKIIVTHIVFDCDNANTVNVAVRVGLGASTTPTTTGVVLTHPGVPPGSGLVHGDGSGIIGIGADAEDLRITCSVPTTGSCRVKVSYYIVVQ